MPLYVYSLCVRMDDSLVHTCGVANVVDEQNKREVLDAILLSYTMQTFRKYKKRIVRSSYVSADNKGNYFSSEDVEQEIL